MPEPNSPAIPGRAIYTVADRQFFIGAVALVNSLRLMGHQEPILVLDCGLTPEQLRILEPEARASPAPPSRSPSLLKPLLPLMQPAETMLLIDADVIATRPFDELFAIAEEEGGVAFTDPLDRFKSEWQTLLGLPTLRRQTYFNSGILVLSRRVAEPLLVGVREGGDKVDLTQSMDTPGMSPDYPLYFRDQDIANAVVSSVLPPETLQVLEYRLAPHPPFPGVALLDPTALDCAYPDGVRPYALHHIQSKPWLADVVPTVYSRLLPRLLLADDVPIRLQPEMLPLRLRTGPAAEVARRYSSTVARLTRLKGKIGVRRRLASLQDRR